jgi:hypothetical protein
LQILVEEQAANLYNGEIKFKPIFWSGRCGIAYMDSFSGYFEINEQYSKLLEYSAQELQKDFSIRNTSWRLQPKIYPTGKLKEQQSIQWKNDI